MSATRRWPGYRWAIVAAMFIITMMSVGTTLYAFGVLVKPMAEDLRLPRATVNMGYVILQLGAAVAGPWVGRLVDRMSARLILMLAAPVFAASLLAISASDNLWIIAAITLVPLALSWVATASLIATVLVARWFDEHRSLAMGIISASTSAGGFLVVPAVVWLLSHVGWRHTVAIEGIVVGVVIFLLAFVVVRDWPAGRNTALHLLPVRAHQSSSFLLYLARSPQFWALALSAGSVTAIDQALLASLIPFGTDKGFTLEQAGYLLSCLTGFSIAGKLGISALADRIDKQVLFAAIALSNAGFLAILLALPPYGILLPVCCVMGFLLGGTMPVWYAMAADLYGAENFGGVIGAMTPITLAMAMIVMWWVGRSFDIYGSYSPAFASFAVVTVIAALGIQFTRPRVRPRGLNPS